MTAILENNTIPRLTSLESQDFNRKVSNAVSNFLCPHMIDSENHKEGYKEKPVNLQNKHNSICPLPSVKNTTPLEPVSVSFAVDQWFNILLVHMHKQNASLLDNLAVPFEAKPVIINV